MRKDVNIRDSFGEPQLEGRIAALLQQGVMPVLLTVLQKEGSAPRGAGTRALLTADPDLSQPEDRPVLERVRALFSDTPDIFN